jgi:hypothetical protein
MMKRNTICLGMILVGLVGGGGCASRPAGHLPRAQQAAPQAAVESGNANSRAMASRSPVRMPLGAGDALGREMFSRDGLGDRPVLVETAEIRD